MSASTFKEWVDQQFEVEMGYPRSDLEGLAPLRGLQTEFDPLTTARLPQDGDADHPVHSEPNPFLRVPFSQLRALIKNGTLCPEDERKARAALQMMQAHHNDVLDGGRMPGRPR